MTSADARRPAAPPSRLCSSRSQRTGRSRCWQCQTARTTAGLRARSAAACAWVAAGRSGGGGARCEQTAVTCSRQVGGSTKLANTRSSSTSSTSRRRRRRRRHRSGSSSSSRMCVQASAHPRHVCQAAHRQLHHLQRVAAECEIPAASRAWWHSQRTVQHVRGCNPEHTPSWPNVAGAVSCPCALHTLAHRKNQPKPWAPGRPAAAGVVCHIQVRT